MNIRFISAKFNNYPFYFPAKKDTNNVKMDENNPLETYYSGTAVVIPRYRFIIYHLTYEDFIEGIKPQLTDNEVAGIQE